MTSKHRYVREAEGSFATAEDAAVVEAAKSSLA